MLPKKYEKEGIHADVIVVDPPRKGCDSKCLETMLAMKSVVFLSKLKTKRHVDIEIHTDELDLTSAESKATYAELKQKYPV